MNSMKEIANLEIQSTLNSTLITMFEERVAFILKDKTVQQLKNFASKYAPEANTTGVKAEVIQSILTELELETTHIGQYLCR